MSVVRGGGVLKGRVYREEGVILRNEAEIESHEKEVNKERWCSER